VADEKKPNAISRYFRETMGELRKVNWPTWPEARRMTFIVILVLVVMAVFLGLVDAGASRLLALVVGA